MAGVNHCSLHCRLHRRLVEYSWVEDIPCEIRRCDWLKTNHSLEIHTGLPVQEYEFATNHVAAFHPDHQTTKFRQATVRATMVDPSHLKPRAPNLGGVNHCSLHRRLATFRGLMYQGKYGAVIGLIKPIA